MLNRTGGIVYGPLWLLLSGEGRTNFPLPGIPREWVDLNDNSVGSLIARAFPYARDVLEYCGEARINGGLEPSEVPAILKLEVWVRRTEEPAAPSQASGTIPIREVDDARGGPAGLVSAVHGPKDLEVWHGLVVDDALRADFITAEISNGRGRAAGGDRQEGCKYCGVFHRRVDLLILVRRANAPGSLRRADLPGCLRRRRRFQERTENLGEESGEPWPRQVCLAARRDGGAS